MKIFVTGATGFIGRHVTTHLNRTGHEVAALVRSSSTIPAAIAHVPRHVVDAAPDALAAILAREQPDCVVHLAAHYVATHTPADVDALVEGNIGFTARLLDAMAQAGCDALVYASSAWQYGEAPANLYAASKNAALALTDFYRSAHALRMLELVSYDSYGPDDPRGKLISVLKDAAETADIVPMTSGEQRLHLVHVDDIARGFALACEIIAGQAPGMRQRYRLPSAKSVSVRELVALFNRIHTKRPVHVSWGERPYRPGEIFHPWEGCPRLPGWAPSIDLMLGLQDLAPQTATGRFEGNQ